MEWTDGRIIVSGKQNQNFSQATKVEVVFVFNQSAPLIWHSLLVAARHSAAIDRYIYAAWEGTWSYLSGD